jgi:hypothetical protein
MQREASSAGIDYKTKLRLNETEFLTPEQGGECGGILLYYLDKRIVCNNTLKSRLDLCFEELLPQIRTLLFPEKQAPSTPATGKSDDLRSEAIGGESGKHGHKKH